MQWSVVDAKKNFSSIWGVGPKKVFLYLIGYTLRALSNSIT